MHTTHSTLLPLCLSLINATNTTHTHTHTHTHTLTHLKFNFSHAQSTWRHAQQHNNTTNTTPKTHTQTHIHTYTKTYIHTHTHTQRHTVGTFYPLSWLFEQLMPLLIRGQGWGESRHQVLVAWQQRI